MRLDIFSDVICPWCFIGKRRLERALAQRRPAGLEVRWRAFQLNPEMPLDGMDRRLYLELKFGGAADAKQIYDRIEDAGDQEGIGFRFDRIERTPNTIKAHRLIRFASRRNRQDEIVEALFHSYFRAGVDIGDEAALADLAAAAGLERDEVERFLAGPEDSETVKAEDQLARQTGIQGVPTFIFAGKYALSGAHEPEVLHQMFDLAEQERQTEDSGALAGS